MKFIITDFFERGFNKVVKVKLRTNTKTYRILMAFDNINLIILFLNIFDKNQKYYGENLNWDLHKGDIMFWKTKNEECINFGKYRNIFIKK